MLSKENTQGEGNNVLHQYENIINTMSGINYIIDKEYKIAVYSKEKWDDFARSNDGDELTDLDKVLNQSVLNNFSGEKVRKYYKQIYDLIFDGEKTEIIIKAKCDAPEVLRDNVLYLTPVYDDPKKKQEVVGILHQSLILKVEQRPQSVELLKRKAVLPKGEFIEICSLCKKVKYELNGKVDWISPEKYKEISGITNRKLDHSICDECSVILDEFM